MAAGDAAAAEAVLLSFGAGAAPSLGKVLAACHSSSSVAPAEGRGRDRERPSPTTAGRRENVARPVAEAARRRPLRRERESCDARLSPHATPEEVWHYARRGHQLARDEEAAALGDALMVTLHFIFTSSPISTSPESVFVPTTAAIKPEHV
ncbi:hypothetical protein DIPPA_32654 [Diplonema papillatum]|nr:hypothetical protein DIPPA_32654 [Diplonema papillatum]